MTSEELKAIDSLTRALWALERRLASTQVLVPSEKPEQMELPGMPTEDFTPPERVVIQPPPKSNAVKIYEALAKHFDGYAPTYAEMHERNDVIDVFRESTEGKVSTRSLGKLLSAYKEAGAIKILATRPKSICFCDPTDEIRIGIDEYLARRRKESVA